MRPTKLDGGVHTMQPLAEAPVEVENELGFTDYELCFDG